jgi:hypothetical protein
VSSACASRTHEPDSRHVKHEHLNTVRRPDRARMPPTLQHHRRHGHDRGAKTIERRKISGNAVDDEPSGLYFAPVPLRDRLFCRRSRVQMRAHASAAGCDLFSLPTSRRMRRTTTRATRQLPPAKVNRGEIGRSCFVEAKCATNPGPGRKPLLRKGSQCRTRRRPVVR